MSTKTDIENSISEIERLNMNNNINDEQLIEGIESIVDEAVDSNNTITTVFYNTFKNTVEQCKQAVLETAKLSYSWRGSLLFAAGMVIGTAHTYQEMMNGDVGMIRCKKWTISGGRHKKSKQKKNNKKRRYTRKY